MYEFTHEFLCGMKDITIMFEKSSFGYIFKKPQYEGHLIEDMFLWALNYYYRKMHNERI